MSRVRRESGAVSLFMVIFAMLLMSVVTISFLRIMTSDQSRASNNDLAQSAYDSAQAGVEDAKRFLVWYADQCKDDSSTACANARSVLGKTECNAALEASGVVKASDIADTASGEGTGEVKVQQSTAVDEAGDNIDEALDQAYTCVTIDYTSKDYLANIAKGTSILVPLNTADGKPVTTVTLEWFSRKDETGADGAVTLDSLGDNGKFRLATDWGERPAILRSQLMQVGSEFTLSDFDGSGDEAGKTTSDTNTVFLFPTLNGFSTADITTRDTRAKTLDDATPKSGIPLATNCVTPVPTEGYSCKITLTLPKPIGGEDATLQYLRLSTYYKGAHVRITLGDGAEFSGVQAVVDSTGRANDVFRRVESRVNLYDSFPYPEAAIDLTGNFCKDFQVTNSTRILGSCTP